MAKDSTPLNNSERIELLKAAAMIAENLEKDTLTETVKIYKLLKPMIEEDKDSIVG